MVTQGQVQRQDEYPRVDHRHHPIAWQLAADHAIAMRGPERYDLDVGTAPVRLDAWLRGNPDALAAMVAT